MHALLRSILIAGLVPTAALAADVRVTVHGEVGFNVIGGDHTGIPPGAPVVMSFLLDSGSFVDSPSFPTRGYVIDPATFEMSVGGAAVTMEDPQPFGPAFFVIRDNDPAVDGFLVSRNVDVPFPVQVAIPALAPIHDLDFLVTYPDTTVPSLDLLDAVGSYDFTGISVFGWTIGRFGGIGAEYIYESMTIEALAPGCNPADVAGPFGVLDLADLQAFVAAFNNQDPLADIAEPIGVLDLADVQLFIAEFLAGCP